MSARDEWRVLASEVRQGLDVLGRLEERLADFLARKVLDRQPGPEEAMVVTQYLSGYYTCLETTFLRISQCFENHLPPNAWHQALLDKMGLDIEGLRPRVLSDAVRNDLRELLKFRHFSRYYFELDYDWDKLGFLLRKFSAVRAPVRKELETFVAFVESLMAE